MHRLVIALVTLLGLSGIAFVAGYLFLFGAAADRAAALAPASTAVYVNVYLQPSTAQQMRLSELIGRLPGFADDASLDEKVDQVVQNLLSGTGVDYRAQVKPWLGNQVAIAAWPAETTDGLTDGPMAVLAHVRDPEAARSAVADLAAESGATTTVESYAGIEIQVGGDGAYAFVDEMLVIGADADAVRAIVDVDGGDASLADRGDFVATMDALEPDHLAAAFLDIAALSEATGTEQQITGVTTAGAVLVAEDDGLRMSGSAPFDGARAAPSDRAGFALGGAPSSLVDWMPDETVAELVVFGLRQALEDAETAVGEVPEGEDVASAIDTFRALAAFGLGVDLDADILPLLDREVAIAITGVEGGTPSGQVLLRPTDPEAATSALGRLVAGLGAVGAETSTESIGEVEATVVTLPDFGSVAYAVVDGIVIIGLGTDDVAAAIEAHETGASLGASEAYARTFEVAGTRGGNEAWIDVAALLELAGEPAELPTDLRDILSRIGSVAFTAPSRDDQIEFHVVLTVEP